VSLGKASPARDSADRTGDRVVAGFWSWDRLEQSRTELLPSALPKPLPGPLPSFPSSLSLPALFPLPARALRYRQAQLQNRATINELKLELAPFSNTPHTSHQSSIPRTGRSSTSSSLDPHTRPVESLAGTALPSDTEPP